VAQSERASKHTKSRKKYQLPSSSGPCALYQVGDKISAITEDDALARTKEKFEGKISTRKISAWFREKDLGEQKLMLYREIEDSRQGSNLSSRMSPRIPMKKFVAKTNNRIRSFRIRHFQKQNVDACEAVLDSSDSLTEHDHKSLAERRNCKAYTARP
jgi:hypothetical protein